MLWRRARHRHDHRARLTDHDAGTRDLTGREVLFLVSALRRAGVRCWIEGGWGVDALLGHQSRPHDDLDVVVAGADVDPLLLDTLAPLHFTIAEDHRPARLVLRDHTRRQVDVRPIDSSDPRYPADQLGTGRIEGRPVPCIGPQLQLDAHQGYAPTERDRADVAALCDAFGLDVPAGYR